MAAASSCAKATAGEKFRCFQPPQLMGMALSLPGCEDAAARAAYHQLLRLPEVPLLKPECCLPWVNEVHPGSTGRLVNPHLDCGRKPGWWKGGDGTRTAFVAGEYEYCHYMQDKFDDNGWGCMYRSFQTCVTWYRLQFYSSRPLPGIMDIQEQLKRVDHAHAELKVGSRVWIGSTEGMYLLQDYFGGLDLDCDQAYCHDVAEFANKAQQFATHFENHGTPVMIGAGQRAFTMVGICYEAGGDVAFLIVDPHYTGADVLKPILSKGWVGWKKLDFFKKEADGGFINCVLPRRPRGPGYI